MPRDSSGNYTLPSGNPVVTGSVISSDWANSTMSDVGNEITDSLSRSGQGGMLAPLFFLDGGIGAPGISWVLEPTMGFYRAGSQDMRAVVANRDSVRFVLDNQIEVSRDHGGGLTFFPLVDSFELDEQVTTLQADIDTRVLRAGDTMTGQLNGLTPVDPANMATKEYIDDLLIGGVGAFVLKAGDSMTGQLEGITPVGIADMTRKDYVDGLIAGIGGSVTDRVFRAGDTMTGALEGINPVGIADFTRKDYVDGLIASIGGSVTDRVLKTGDTMTGQLILPGGGANDEAAQVVQITDALTAHVGAPDPHVQYQLEAEKGANDGYCPLNISGLVPVPLLPLTNIEFLGGFDASSGNLPATPAGGGFYIIIVAGTLNVVPSDGSSSTPTPTAVAVGDDIIFSNVDSFWYQIIQNFAQQDARYVQVVGDTMTGQLKGITPVSVDDMTRKDYVDGEVSGANSNADSRVLRAGDTMTGQLKGITPVSVNDLTRKDYVDAADLVNSNEAAAALAAANNANTNANSRILRAGDTMTGQLSGITPSANANLTRKDYVDGGVNGANNNANSRIARSGDTMSGQLSGITPVSAANLTRKDYVDLNKLNTDFLRTGDRLDINNVPT